MDRAEKFHPRRESVVNRGQAFALAARQPQRAYDLALTIPDGWYRCQAMAYVALQAPGRLADKAFRQARAAAAASHDTYQHAAVLAFAIEPALARGRDELARDMLGEALALVPVIEPLASRAYALEILWRKVLASGERRMLDDILGAMRAHVHPDRSWRARRLYRNIADDLAQSDADRVQELIRGMPHGKARAHLERRYPAR